MSYDLHAIREAGRLIALGLARVEPGDHVEYRELIDRYGGDFPFRALVDTVSEGLTLRVVACTERAGLVLAPAGEHGGDDADEAYIGRSSPFAPLADELRRVSVPVGVRDRQLWTLGLLVVCYCAFPTEEALHDDTQVGQVDPRRAEQVLRDVCRELDRRVREVEDPPVDQPELERVWRAYLATAETGSTKDDRSHLKSAQAVITRVCRALQQLRCLHPVRRTDPVVFRGTPKFQIQVRELAGLPYWSELAIAAGRLTGEEQP